MNVLQKCVVVNTHKVPADIIIPAENLIELDTLEETLLEAEKRESLVSDLIIDKIINYVFAALSVHSYFNTLHYNTACVFCMICKQAKYLGTTGGDNTTRRIMVRVFGKVLATELNWEGRGKETD